MTGACGGILVAGQGIGAGEGATAAALGLRAPLYPGGAVVGYQVADIGNTGAFHIDDGIGVGEGVLFRVGPAGIGVGGPGWNEVAIEVELGGSGSISPSLRFI